MTVWIEIVISTIEFTIKINPTVVFNFSEKSILKELKDVQKVVVHNSKNNGDIPKYFT